jgi:L-rhamnose-H+ transport protein
MVCLAGIGICGYAGVLKERKLTAAQKKEAIKDFALVKGFIVAICGGLMSAFMAFAFQVGKPIAQAALDAGTSKIYQNNPLLVVALAGGFTTNFFYCIIMNVKNKSIGDYVTGIDRKLLINYILAIISGTVWYLQFYFYGMGITKMGRFDFTSWSIFMAFIIVFSNFWGIYLKEWKLVNWLTKKTLFIGIIVLIISIFIIGMGSYLPI